jgi:DNA-binding CsgD family transcriptional regulator
MVQPHLINKTNFKRYVSSLPFPDDIFSFDETFDPLYDVFFSSSIGLSKWFGARCIDNPHARTEKRKLIKKVLSYLTKWDMYYPDVLVYFYSEKTPGYEDKVCNLQRDLKNMFIDRYRFLKALSYLRKSVEIVRLNDYLSMNTSTTFFSEYASTDYEKVLRAWDNLDLTEDVEGLELDGVLSFQEIAIHVRQEAKQIIDATSLCFSDDQLRGMWISQREDLLSNNNLKRLSNLICDAYKVVFASEIIKFRSENKKENDRKRYTPTQKYSKKEKTRIINQLRLEGKSQRVIAEMMGISKSTVEAHWKKD